MASPAAIALLSWLAATATASAQATYPSNAELKTAVINGDLLLFDYTTLVGTQTIMDNVHEAYNIQNNVFGLTGQALQERRARAFSDAQNPADTTLGDVLANGWGNDIYRIYYTAINDNAPQVASGSNIFNAFDFGTAYGGFSSTYTKNYFGAASTDITYPDNTTDSVAGSVPALNNTQYPVNALSYLTPSGQAANPNTEGNVRPYQLSSQYAAQYPPGLTQADLTIPQPSLTVFDGKPYTRPGTPPADTDNNLHYNQVVQELNTSASFPSGHTTFGYSSGIIMAMMLPGQFQNMMYRSSEYGSSRIIMGAHYPLDVIGGRTLATYQLAQWLQDPDNLQLIKDAGTDLEQLIEQAVGSQTLADKLINEPITDFDAKQSSYEYTLTYGLTPLESDLPTTVDESAAVLLATRFPYLDASQRLDILESTMLSSSPLESSSLGANYQGWARLNLFDAAGGYGALTSNTTVTMNAALGGFNAYDTWNTDIDGPGSTGILTKAGTGQLNLTGNNSFGGVEVEGGTLRLTANNTFSGASNVGGAGGPAQLHVTGQVSTSEVNVNAQGELVVDNGGTVNSQGNITVADSTGTVRLYVPASGANNMLNAGTSGNGDFVNNGTVYVYAGVGLAGGTYMPISVGSVSGAFSGSGTFVAVGGTWNASNEFVVSSITHVPVTGGSGGVTNQDLSGQRLGFDFGGEPTDDLVAAFSQTAGTQTFNVTELNIAAVLNELVLAAYDFDTTLSSDPVLLSFFVGEGYDFNNIALAHSEDNVNWTLYDPDTLTYRDGWVSFDVDSFSSYAVLVPEPRAYAMMLAFGVLAFLLNQRRRQL